MGDVRVLFRTLSFLSLFFRKKAGKTHQKNKDFVILTEPLKSLEKKGKRSNNKERKSSQGEKTRNSKKNKGLRVPNGVFQTVFFRFLASPCDKVKTLAEGQRMPENAVFSRHFGAFCPCGSWLLSEHTTLKNTV